MPVHRDPPLMPIPGATTHPARHAAAPGSPGPVFSRADLERGPLELLSTGRWANAVLYRYRHGGSTWTVKDFRPRGLLTRNLVGRLLVRRELRALQRVAGNTATPQGAFRVDAHALAYRYVPGRGLRGSRGVALAPDFFPTIERQLLALHRESRLVHLDLRNVKNILITEHGEPLLLDFQSAIGTRWMPAPLRRFLEQIDLAAVYKHWRKRSPDTLGPERAAALDRINRLRPLWALRGYAGTPPPHKRRGGNRS